MGPSPNDTPLSATARFFVEVAAWIAAPWAAFEMTENWLVAMVVAVVVLTLPAVFSTPGDKHQVVVATPGPIRTGIELVLAVVAVLSAWAVWPSWLAVVVSVVVAVSLVAGWPRTRWLVSGAPPA